MRITKELLASSARKYKSKPFQIKIFKNESKNEQKQANSEQNLNEAVTAVKPLIPIYTKHNGNEESNSIHRENEMKIQMLSKPLYDQIFRNCKNESIDDNVIDRYLLRILNKQQKMYFFNIGKLQISKYFAFTRH